MNVLKIAGLIIAFLMPSVYGFYKAYSVAERSRKLKDFFVGLGELAPRVKVENIPKERLFSKCFSKKLLKNDFTVDAEFLKPEDISFINEFLSGFGVKDKLSEYERIKLYSERIQKILEGANEEKEKLCRLYSSLGVLSGLAICIFLF